MIRFFQCENFKSLRRLELPLSNLNLFFGQNGMGKSSVLQSLMLLRQSYWNNNKSHLLMFHINGDLIELGKNREIMTQTRDEDWIRYVIANDSGKLLDVKYVPEMIGSLSNTLKSDRIFTLDDGFKKEALFENGFHYLGAEHISPQVVYYTGKWNEDSINPFGNDGRYAIPFLALNGESYRVPNELCCDNSSSDRLIDQVDRWMDKISPSIRVRPEYNEIDETAKLWISYYDENGIGTGSYSPVNTGFGIPYVLPLIIELLVSKPGDMIMVENPESHLHPIGQAEMARLIAKTAAYGVQILCESHSDHIINGVRVAVKNSEINNTNVTINYFTQFVNHETEVINVEIDDKGSLSEFPKGLLDEWGLLMAELIRR